MKRYLFYFIGLFISAVGITGVIVAELGTGAWDSVFVGLTNKVGLSPGSWNIITGGLLMLFNASLAKKKPEFLSFLTVFILGVFIDINLFLYSFIDIVTLPEKMLLFAISFVCMALGVGSYLQAKFPPTPIDSLMMVVHKRFNISMAFSRLICEITALTTGLFLAGPVSYGTVVIVLAIGPCIQYAYRKMDVLYNRPKKEAAVV
ncbi:membrane protein [Alkalicella caledoniensis]|uniref:Membrane protein n=1 Tax=Alkalicella caledoniensis TaxID=2731377 RepID=A0A7G9WB14_ALKCA|nr:hypothetical protein [Alkalicella caledoniensis]QNO15876.1 membrane protein [Alkalicella caledoniensis]